MSSYIVVILGSNGMMGRCLYLSLSEKYTTIGITRDKFDVMVDDIQRLEIILDDIGSNNLIIINCIGIIPQKVDKKKIREYVEINAIFPRELSMLCLKKGYIFIHITTDCVFDGKKGSPYLEDDKHDSDDIYGLSKSMGERLVTGIVLRSSIIGEESKNRKGLIEWLKSSKNKTIQGYTNSLWNGVTCLKLSEIIEDMIKDNFKNIDKIVHIFSKEIVTKHDLCRYVNDVYDLNLNIVPVYDRDRCDRSIGTNKNGIEVKEDIKSQIIRQKIFLSTQN